MTTTTTTAAAALRITAFKAISGLHRVVRRHGRQTVYRIPEQAGCCVYVERGACSCLIAHVLDDLGVPIEALEVQNGAAITSVHVDGVEFTDAALQILAAAQQQQDWGETWGQALLAALAVYGRLCKELDVPPTGDQW